MRNPTLEQWQEQMRARVGLALAGFLEGSYREVCQGHVCPTGHVLRVLDEFRDRTGVFALTGPHHDPWEGDVFYGVASFWINERNWLLDNDVEAFDGQMEERDQHAVNSEVMALSDADLAEAQLN